MLLQPNERWKLYDTKPSTEHKWFKNFVAYKDGRSIVAEYDSPQALADAFRKNVCFPDDIENNVYDAYRQRGLINPQYGTYNSLHNETKDNWMMGSHFDSVGEALTSIYKGEAHPDLVKKFETAKAAIMENSPDLRNLQNVAYTKRRRKVFADEGDELDIDRWMAGDPEQWSKKGTVNAAKRSARIFYSYPMTAGTSPQQFATGVAYLAAYSDIIESAGVACEIVLGVMSTDTNVALHNTCVAVKLKQAHEPLDVQKLLCVGESFFLRLLVFNSYTSLDGSVVSYYGTMMSEAEEKKQFMDFYNPDVFLRGENGFENDSQIRATINDIKTIFNIDKNNEQ